LQLLQGIVERKTTIAILANIRLEARDAQLHFLATDLEVGLRSRCAASVSKPGALTIQAKKLYEIIRALPEGDVRIGEEKAANVRIAADNFTSRLQTMPLDDYPTLPEAAAAPLTTLPGALLRTMIEKIQFAMTSEDTRYYLNGALLVIRPDNIGLVSTDGHRLALAGAKHDGAVGKDEELRIILPRKTVGELGRLLAETEGDVTYSRGENHLFFGVGDRLLISRVVEGQFPAYEKVIPKGNDKRVEFERDRLAAAIRRVSILSNERSKAIKLEFESGKVEISSSSGEFGEARETLSVDYGGPAVRTSFNAQYLIDFLGVVGTDTVAMELKDEVSQAVMKPVGAENFDYTYVLMPMRV
jgi:DNA polymerase-3 subunit beta